MKQRFTHTPSNQVVVLAPVSNSASLPRQEFVFFQPFFPAAHVRGCLFTYSAVFLSINAMLSACGSDLEVVGFSIVTPLHSDPWCPAVPCLHLWCCLIHALPAWGEMLGGGSGWWAETDSHVPPYCLFDFIRPPANILPSLCRVMPAWGGGVGQIQIFHFCVGWSFQTQLASAFFSLKGFAYF